MTVATADAVVRPFDESRDLRAFWRGDGRHQTRDRSPGRPRRPALRQAARFLQPRLRGRRACAHPHQLRARALKRRRSELVDPQTAAGHRGRAHRAARAYDRIEEVPERYKSKQFRWQVPIDEEAWRYGHNGRHHGATNVAGRDADIHFGTVRLTEQTPHRGVHRFQLPMALLVLFPNFAFLMNLHFTGVSSTCTTTTASPVSSTSCPTGRRRAVARPTGGRCASTCPTTLIEYVLFPALAGPIFLEGDARQLARRATLRDVYSAATIFCGHVGEDTASYPPGSTKAAQSRGAWYAMQIEATQQLRQVSRPLSVLCGGLDLQIRAPPVPAAAAPPPARGRAARAARCAQQHGVTYRSAELGSDARSARCARSASCRCQRDNALDRRRARP